jgi:hypothetical protein
MHNIYAILFQLFMSGWMLEQQFSKSKRSIGMRIIQVCIKSAFVSMLLLSMFACKSLSPTTSPETIKPIFILPTVTAAIGGSANLPVPTGDSTDCPPKNVAFPELDKLENYLGWHYLQDPAAFKYPKEEFGTLLSIDKDYDYGVSAYNLGDNSFMLVLEKLLCKSSAGLPAWEIVDAVRTGQLAQNELIYPGSNCIKNDEPTTDYQFVVIDQSNNGKVYSAWSIDQNKKITESPVDGLSCSYGG